MKLPVKSDKIVKAFLQNLRALFLRQFSPSVSADVTAKRRVAYEKALQKLEKFSEEMRKELDQ